MTQKAGTSPDGGAARLLIGIPLGTLIALAMASMIGWVVLGLPVAAYDPLKMPQFIWYYRGDPHVVRAMAGGLAGGFTLLGGLIYALWARGAPLHGDARFANERELKRHGFRSASGIVVGRKGGRFLTFGGSEHVLVEAPTRSGKGTGIVIPNLLTWQGSVVVLDVEARELRCERGVPREIRAGSVPVQPDRPRRPDGALQSACLYRP